MRGLAWPKRLTHQELTASRYRRPSKSYSHTPSPRAMGTSGSDSCCFICVQGCHTAAALRVSRVSLRVLTRMREIAAGELQNVFTSDVTHAKCMAFESARKGDSSSLRRDCDARLKTHLPMPQSTSCTLYAIVNARMGADVV